MEASMKTRVTKIHIYFKLKWMTMDEIHPYYWQVDNDCMKKIYK